MALSWRTEFYDTPTVMAQLNLIYGKFDYCKILRVQSCYEPGTNDRYRTEREKMTIEAPTKNEREAVKYAAEMAGEFLDSLPSTDLAEMGKENYDILVELICSHFQNKLCMLAYERRSTITDADIPY